MWEIFKTIITSSAGSLGFVVGFVLLCGWLIIKVTKATTQWEDKQKGIEKLEGRVEAISTDLHYIKATLEVMRNNPPSSNLTQSHSPVSLTPIGEEVAKKISARKIIASNWEKIVDCIERANVGNNAYDIQQFCIETASIAIEKFFSEEDVVKIKEFAYNEGKTLAYYGGMFGILIRDKYFDFKNIPIEAVDLGAPDVKAVN